MDAALQRIHNTVPAITGKAQFGPQDMIAIVQGITGFLGGIKLSGEGNDHLGMLSHAVGLFGHFATKCSLGSLNSIKDRFATWLKFGEQYKALKDSSELDFDQLDPGAVPEIMQVRSNFDYS